MRYIGLDLGTKTLGIALSDKIGIIATSIKTLHFEEENYADVLEELSEIIKKEEVNAIVLGLPKNMHNSLGDSASRSLMFKEMLEKKFNMPVYLQDERMSSVEAHNIMLEGNLSRKKRKKHVDALAANIILQRFLDSRKG